MLRIAGFFLVPLFLFVSVATAVPRVAVLAPAGSTAEKISSLLEMALSSDATLQLVDRRQLFAVLQEQQLAVCFQPQDVTERVELGRLAKADTLVVLREIPSPIRHLELVICESAHGLRLLDEPTLLTDDLAADVRAIGQQVTGRIGKTSEPITTVVAVPDFVCDDLTHTRAGDGEAYAALIQQSLLNRPGVAVVEIAEARSIAVEMALAGQRDLDRSLPCILLGNYRNQGTAPRRTIDFHLRLQRGTASLAEGSESQVDPAEIAGHLLKRTDSLIGAGFAKLPPGPDPDADARQLHARAATLLQCGEYQRGLCLCEASLLVRSRPETHRDAAFAALELCISERNKTGGNASSASNPSDSAFPDSCQPLLERGIEHAESYMKATRLDYLSPGDRVLQRYRLDCPPDVMAEMLLRVARAKFDSAIKDDTLRYAANLKWNQITPPARRYNLITSLAALAQQAGDIAWIEKMFRASTDDSPERAAAIAELAASANRYAHAAAASLTSDTIVSVQQAPPRPSTATGPIGPATQPVVTAVPIDVGLPHVYGHSTAGQTMDLAWGLTNPHGPISVRIVDREGSAKEICTTSAGSTPVFDGESVWTAGDGSEGPQVLRIKPSTGVRSSIGPKDGLPDAGIDAFVAAPLVPGRICAAITIGNGSETRSYIALISRAAGENQVTVLHEEKLTAQAPGVDRSDPSLSFKPRNATVLSNGIAAPNTSITIAFTGGCVPRLVRFPDAESLHTGRGVTVVTAPQLRGTSEFRGQLFDTRRVPGNGISADLLRCSADGKTDDVINRNAVFGSSSVGDRGAYIFCPVDSCLYFAPTPRDRFQRLSTNLPPGFLNTPENTLCRSNPFGLVILTGGTLFQFRDGSGGIIR